MMRNSWKLPRIFQALIMAGLVALLPDANAQSAKIPTKLAGKWATPDSRDGQRVEVVLDAARGTATLSLGFADKRCTVRAAPMTLALLGGRITLKLLEELSNPCVTDMTLEMVPNRDTKGQEGYLAELRLTGTAANRAPILRGRLTPP